MKMMSPIGFPAPPSKATLRSWSVVEVDDNGDRVRLLVGLLTDTKLRVTTQIEQFEGGQVITRSGSVYTLYGPPASAEQLKEQRSRRDALMSGRDAVDVTRHFVRPDERLQG